MKQQKFSVPEEAEGKTLGAVVRQFLDIPWARSKKLIEGRMVLIGKEVCRDHARRVHASEEISVISSPVPEKKLDHQVVIRFLDPHIVVVEKPSGISSVRHPTEREWTKERRALSPTLEELVPSLIRQKENRGPSGNHPRLRVVQRLDKETSGLLVFARTVEAERHLGHQFRLHTVKRRYWAVAQGTLTDQTIQSHLVKDRGDGRRGSTRLPGLGKESVTHVKVIRHIGPLTLVECRLETGRTHQIRIHLSEKGHPICGEPVYLKKTDGTVVPDEFGAPRLALHALELGFEHPVTGAACHWEAPFPTDLENWLKTKEKERRSDGNPVESNPPRNRGKSVL